MHQMTNRRIVSIISLRMMLRSQMIMFPAIMAKTMTTLPTKNLKKKKKNRKDKEKKHRMKSDD
jgi:hypothetical protein